MQMGAGAAEVMKGGTGLTKLSLFNSRLGDLGGRALAGALAGGHYLALQELDLAACSLDVDVLTALFTVLQGGAAPALEVLPLPASVASDADGNRTDVGGTGRQVRGRSESLEEGGGRQW